MGGKKATTRRANYSKIAFSGHLKKRNNVSQNVVNLNQSMAVQGKLAYCLDGTQNSFTSITLILSNISSFVQSCLKNDPHKQPPKHGLTCLSLTIILRWPWEQKFFKVNRPIVLCQRILYTESGRLDILVNVVAGS